MSLTKFKAAAMVLGLFAAGTPAVYFGVTYSKKPTTTPSSVLKAMKEDSSGSFIYKGKKYKYSKEQIET